MQYLKGNNYKSVTLSKIKETTDSIYFAYGKDHIPFADYECNSKGNTFREFLKDVRDTLYLNGSKYEYILIWTNEPETTINSVWGILSDIEETYCTCMVVACK